MIEGLSHGKRVNSIYSRARGEWGERGEEGAKEREREREKAQQNIVPATLQKAMLTRKQVGKILRFLEW